MRDGKLVAVDGNIVNGYYVDVNLTVGIAAVGLAVTLAGCDLLLDVLDGTKHSHRIGQCARGEVEGHADVDE